MNTDMAFRFRPLYAVLLLSLIAAAATTAYADAAQFDLTGPKLEVTVSRAGKTLPVSEVPNLQEGDRLSIRADLPETQSVHYLMVAAFLRGSTNPPPEDWFFRSETWNRKDVEGLNITVPKGAQQVLVFLAPETGGDFKTLTNAVRGRPGSFVRASQDLNQASLDRSRLDTYLNAVRGVNSDDSDKLKDISELLARSLAIKLDPKCFDRETEQQAPCLMQDQDSLILNDGHSTSIVEALTSGPSGDLAMQLSYTPPANYGFNSPYIASAMDIARILDSLHTAQYQYIPGLAKLHANQMSLMLNTPPSFHNPKSVIVVALPAVESPQPPPLHPVDPEEMYCAEKTSLVLPVEGAPLVFSTAYAHDVTLHLTGKDGKVVDVAAKADPEKGGFVVDTKGLSAANFGDSVDASVNGYWGFDKYDGPTFKLQNAHTEKWQLASGDQGSLIVGREQVVHLQAADAGCVDSILLKDPAGKDIKAEWKATKPNEIEVKLPLKEAHPGALTLMVQQFGGSQAESVPLHAFSEAGHLDSFTLHAGDATGQLKGNRLDEVADLKVNGVEFTPGKMTTTDGTDQLTMTTKDEKGAAALKQGTSVQAKVTLKDGRALDLSTSIDAPRPSVALIGKSVEPSATNAGSNIQLADPSELPQDAKLTFSVRAQSPASFSHDEKIEVATADGTFTTTLSLGNGGMTLEDAKVALATLDPAKAFGPSAFGPLQFRVVSDGTPGDWQPLATLVRLPVLHDLKCPAAADQACKLSGANLFLVDAVASDPQFQHPVEVPDGFPGYVLPVPHPASGQLYVKLRDDPSVVNQVTLATDEAPRPPAAAHNAKHSARPAYNGDQALPDNSSTPEGSTAQPAANGTQGTSGNAAPSPASKSGSGSGNGTGTGATPSQPPANSNPPANANPPQNTTQPPPATPPQSDDQKQAAPNTQPSNSGAGSTSDNAAASAP